MHRHNPQPRYLAVLSSCVQGFQVSIPLLLELKEEARSKRAQPPQRLWLRPVGPGWSGFAVAGNRATTQEQRGEDEAVICYDVLAGAPLWGYAYPAHFQSPLAGEGPRATPRQPATLQPEGQPRAPKRNAVYVNKMSNSDKAYERLNPLASPSEPRRIDDGYGPQQSPHAAEGQRKLEAALAVPQPICYVAS